MSLNSQLSEYICACFTGIWVESFEYFDAKREIASLCRDNQWAFASWSIASGLKVGGQELDEGGTQSPIAAVRAVNALADGQTAILILENFHKFLGNAEVMQAVLEQIEAGKQSRAILVFLSPVVDIPRELEKSVVCLSHNLPDWVELESIAREIATDSELPENLGALLDAAAGLTRSEAENAFSLSLVRHGSLVPDCQS